MSVKIQDLLKLPSLHNAEVLAGKKGLSKVISSVSVLETINADLINDYGYSNDDVGGSEIVITGFLNAIDDSDTQFRNIQQLVKSGEAGVIIYYLGVFVKKVSNEIIEYANAHNFVVIGMPKNQPNLRYSDAISDIMMAIFKDHQESENIVVHILDAIGRLPTYQQNVRTAIKLLSEYLRMTVVFTDMDLNPIYEAAWPGEYVGIQNSICDTYEYGMVQSFDKVPGSYIYRQRIETGNVKGNLFLISIGKMPTEMQIHQAKETIDIVLNIWSKKEEGSDISELVRAILEDDPMRMRSLARLFHIDIQSIHAMLIISASRIDRDQVKQLAEAATMYCKTAFADVYDGEIVLFVSGVLSKQNIQDIYEHAKQIIDTEINISVFPNLNTTSDVRKAWVLRCSCKVDLLTIMPNRKGYMFADYKFAEQCRNIIDSGEEKLKEVLSLLDCISDFRDAKIMIKTLEIYLFDADMNLSLAAEIINVHKNTIKYRLKVMSNLFGFRIGSMPATVSLYQAVAIHRLMKS